MWIIFILKAAAILTILGTVAVFVAKGATLAFMLFLMICSTFKFAFGILWFFIKLPFSILWKIISPVVLPIIELIKKSFKKEIPSK